jgi:MYXO-CTERM domain-containing protein
MRFLKFSTRPTRARPRVFLRAIAIAIGLICVSPRAFAASPFAKGPYLQELGATSVVARVELDAKAAVTLEIARGTDAPIVVTDKDESTMHSLRAEGLKPQTRYAYVVKAGGKSSEKGEIVTAPAEDSGAPFTFQVYGDNRTDDAAHALVVRAMKQSPADFLVHTGDFVDSGGSAQNWQTFFDIETPLLRDRCVFACIGNHEIFEDRAAANYTRFFTTPSATPARLYYSFRWSNTRFFMLNAFDDWTNGEQRAWLDAEMKRAESEKGLAWRVLVTHHGLWSSGPHGASPRLAVAGVADLLASRKVDLVFSGHDHIYERGDASGVRYVVSGGGGAPLYRQEKPLPSTRKFEATYHFVEVKVGSDHVQLVAKRADGSTIEKCGFGKASGWDCDGPALAQGTAAPPQASAASKPSSTPPAPLADKPAEAPSASRCGCAVPGAPATSNAAAFALLAAIFFRARRKAR